MVKIPTYPKIGCHLWMPPNLLQLLWCCHEIRAERNLPKLSEFPLFSLSLFSSACVCWSGESNVRHIYTASTKHFIKIAWSATARISLRQGPPPNFSWEKEPNATTAAMRQPPSRTIATATSRFKKIKQNCVLPPSPPPRENPILFAWQQWRWWRHSCFFFFRCCYYCMECCCNCKKQFSHL